MMFLCHVKTTYIERSWGFRPVDVCVFGFFACLCRCLTLWCLPSMLHELCECLKLTNEVQQATEITLSFSDVSNSHTLRSSQAHDSPSSWSY